MKYVWVICVVVVCACMVLGGCRPYFRHLQQTGQDITPEQYAQLPADQQQQYHETRLIPPSAGGDIDTGTTILEQISAMVAPILPGGLGGIVLGVVAGLGTAWRKTRPYILATRQTVQALEYAKRAAPEHWRATIAPELRKVTNEKTAKIVEKILTPS